MAIKEHIRYQSEDGTSHPSFEAAVAWERYLMVQNHLAAHHRVLQIDLAEIDTIARVICDTQEAVAKLFGVNLKAGVAAPRYFTGGVVKSDPNKVHPAFSPRGEAIVPRGSPLADVAAVRARAAYHGDTVDEILAEDALRQKPAAEARAKASVNQGMDELLEELEADLRRSD